MTVTTFPALEKLDVDAFWRDGYAVLPGTYSQDEIERLREECYRSRDENRGLDLLANDRLRHVLTDGRMAAVTRKLLGVDEVHYGGDSSYTINGTQRGFHKDNADRLDGKAPDWDGRYTQLRFGIYCQDHTKHTGGLNLRVGSHEMRNTTGGENIYVKVKPGDLAVWSMRITHSGNGMLLRFPFKQVPLPTEQDEIPAWKVAKADRDRIAVFAHLGAKDRHAERYGDYLKTRTYMVNSWRAHPYSAEALAEAQASGLSVRDMPAEVKDDPNAGLNEKWQAIPY